MDVPSRIFALETSVVEAGYPPKHYLLHTLPETSVRSEMPPVVLPTIKFLDQHMLHARSPRQLQITTRLVFRFTLHHITHPDTPFSGRERAI